MGHVLAKTILISQTIELIAKKYKLSIEEARNNFYKSLMIISDNLQSIFINYKKHNN